MRPARGKGLLLQKPSLPFELVSNMAHFLYDDGYSVSACTLTCRMWRSACRGYIYRSISLSSPQRYQGLLSFLDNEPTLSRFIIELSIEPKPTEFTLPEVPGWIHEAPAALSARLKNVTNLHLRRIRWSGVEDSTLPFYLAFTVLKCVSITECSFSGSDIGKFANKLSHLEEIRVSRQWPRIFDVDNIHVNPQLSLKSLLLEEVNVQTSLIILAWVRAPNTIYTLQSLSLDVFTIDVANGVRDLLRDLGPTLRHVDLRTPRHFRTTVFGGMRFNIYVEVL